MAATAKPRLRDLLDVDRDSFADGEVPVWNAALGKFVGQAVAGGGGPETDPVAGPALASHAADSTGVHGIADTSLLVVTTDPRLTDQRVPTDASVTAAKVNGALKPSGSAATTDEALRALGHGANQALPGDEPLLPSSGQKNALAGTAGTPGSTNEYVTKQDRDAHAALTEGVHGLPNAAPGEAVRRNSGDTGWEAFDPATQAEFDPIKNAALRQWFDPVRDHGAVGDASLDGTTGTLDSAAIQASIDDAFAAGGGAVPIYKRHRANELVMKSNVAIVFMHRGARFQAPPGQTSSQAILRLSEPSSMPAGGWYQGDANHTAVIGTPFFDGNGRNGAAGDGIRFISGNNDGQYQNTGPTFWNADYWNDSIHVIDHCRVFDAGRHGITLGINMRGARVSNTFVHRARQRGWWLKCTDSFFSLCDAGGCGDGFYFDSTFQSNRMVGCKAWYSYTTAAAPTDGTAWSGTGHGYLWAPRAGTGAGNVLSACESQDNFGHGAKLDGVRSQRLVGFKAGGDTLGAVGLYSSTQDCEYNDIDVHLQWADRVLSPTILVIDGANTKNNNVRIADDPEQAYSGAVTPVTLQNGGALVFAGTLPPDNRVWGPALERWHTVGSAGEPAFENSWADAQAAAGTRLVAFRMAGPGRVEIRGAVRGGTLGTVVFTLPVWARPITTVTLPFMARDVSVASGANMDVFGIMTIGSGGAVQLVRWESASAWVGAVDGTGDRAWIEAGYAL